jgi:hypothetical protein
VATHQITNWIGDDGFPQKSKCQIRRHNPDGDVIFIDAAITRKFVENGKHYVEIQQRTETHRGELSATGVAIAELPSRPQAALICDLTAFCKGPLCASVSP